MSIDIRGSAPETNAETPTDSRNGSVARIVGGSIAAGAATALALTLGVFPGATESVVTGSILLAFGLGWGLLAILSTRRTAHPQRWAYVPATAMTVAGLPRLAESVRRRSRHPSLRSRRQSVPASAGRA